MQVDRRLLRWCLIIGAAGVILLAIAAVLTIGVGLRRSDPSGTVASASLPIENRPNRWRNRPPGPGSADYGAAAPLNDPPRVAPLGVSVAGDSGERPATESQEPPKRLANGTRIMLGVPSRTGPCTLKIINGTSEDAAVKLAAVGSNRAYKYYYIRGDDEYTVRGIAEGSFELFVRQGSAWLPKSRRFSLGESLWKFDRVLAFDVRTEQSEYGRRTSFSCLTVTLHEVVDGNIHKSAVTEDEFGAD